MEEEEHNHEVVLEEDTGDPSRFVDDWKTSMFFEKTGGKAYACVCGALLRVGNGDSDDSKEKGIRLGKDKPRGARVCTRACGARQSRDAEPPLFLTRLVRPAHGREQHAPLWSLFRCLF